MMRWIVLALLCLFPALARADAFSNTPPASPASLSPWPMSLPALASGVIPTRHLQAFRRALDAGSATVVIAGDSTGTQNANNAVAPSENLFGMISSKILAANNGAVMAGAKITFTDRSVGGQTWGALAGAIGSAANTTGNATTNAGVTTIPVTIPAGVTAGMLAFGTGLATGVATAVPITNVTGTTSFDVAGTFTVASGIKITFLPASTPTWYTAPDQNWLQFFVSPLAPDLIVIPMGTNDAQGLGGNKIRDVMTNLQSLTLFPKQPSVLFVINSGHTPVGDTLVHQVGELQAAAYSRSIATAGSALLGSTTGTGAIDIGIIDLGRLDTITRNSYDPVIQYDIQSLLNVAGITTFPYNFPTTGGDFDVQLQFVNGSTTLFPAGAAYNLWFGSVIASGSQNPRINWTNNAGNLQGQFVTAGGSTVGFTSTVPLGTGDVYVFVTVKQSRLTVSAKTLQGSAYVTTTMYDGLVPIAGGTATPQWAISTGTPTPTMNVLSFSGGLPMPRQASATDLQVWGADPQIPNTGGNAINHVGSYGAATLIMNVLETTRLSAHDGALMPLVVPALTAAGTTQGTAAAIAGDVTIISSCAAGAGVVLPKQVIFERSFLVMNRDPTNACLEYPPTSGQIEGSAANVAVSIAAGASATFRQVSATQWRQN